MKYGYIRVSSKGQNIARQDILMKELGVDKVFIDKMSGKDTNRPALNHMLEVLKIGDVVIVESISRFARNTRDLLELIETLKLKNVQFVSKKESIDTTTTSGQFMLTIFGAVAQLERDYIKDRQKEGISAAKIREQEEGIKIFGRPERQDSEQYKKFISEYNKLLSGEYGNMSKIKFAKMLEISRATLYNYINEYEKGRGN